MKGHRRWRRAGWFTLWALILVSPALVLADAKLHPAMQATWERSDLLVASGEVARSWLWGPQPQDIREETYNGGQRLVAYFDKSRMEITDPDADQSSKWFVTNGLLVKELVSGARQEGDAAFTCFGPSQVPVAGMGNLGSDSPRYSSFSTVASLAPGSATPNRTQQLVTATIDRDGRTGEDSQYAQYGVRNGSYEPTFGHNIPTEFWDFLQQTGPVYENGRRVNGPVIDWLYSTGYPITEPFWAKVDFEYAGDPADVYPRRIIKKDVLIQLFERRVLTYTPSNPAAWQVEMGNVGEHYYIWRYEYPYQTPDILPCP